MKKEFLKHILCVTLVGGIFMANFTSNSCTANAVERKLTAIEVIDSVKEMCTEKNIEITDIDDSGAITISQSDLDKALDRIETTIEFNAKQVTQECSKQENSIENVFIREPKGAKVTTTKCTDTKTASNDFGHAKIKANASIKHAGKKYKYKDRKSVV